MRTRALGLGCREHGLRPSSEQKGLIPSLLASGLPARPGHCPPLAHSGLWQATPSSSDTTSDMLPGKYPLMGVPLTHTFPWGGSRRTSVRLTPHSMPSTSQQRKLSRVCCAAVVGLNPGAARGGTTKAAVVLSW